MWQHIDMQAVYKVWPSVGHSNQVVVQMLSSLTCPVKHRHRTFLTVLQTDPTPLACSGIQTYNLCLTTWAVTLDRTTAISTVPEACSGIQTYNLGITPWVLTLDQEQQPLSLCHRGMQWDSNLQPQHNSMGLNLRPRTTAIVTMPQRHGMLSPIHRVLCIIFTCMYLPKICSVLSAVSSTDGQWRGCWKVLRHPSLPKLWKHNKEVHAHVWDKRAMRSFDKDYSEGIVAD